MSEKVENILYEYENNLKVGSFESLVQNQRRLKDFRQLISACKSRHCASSTCKMLNSGFQS